MNPHRLLSTPARRRAVLVGLVLVAVGGAVAYGLAPSTVAGRLVPTLIMGGAVLAVLALASTDPARPRATGRSTRPADERVDTWDTDTGRAVLAHMRITNPWLAAEIENGGRDVVPDTAAGATAPGGADAGFWAGLDIYGPGMAVEGTVYVRRDPGGWDNGTWPAPSCPECHTGRDLWLMWLEDRPRLARLVCSCGTSWSHSAWCTPAGTAWALTQDADEDTGGQVRASGDVDPVLAYWGQMIRRQAGNTPRRPDEA